MGRRRYDMAGPGHVDDAMVYRVVAGRVAVIEVLPSRRCARRPRASSPNAPDLPGHGIGNYDDMLGRADHIRVGLWITSCIGNDVELAGYPAAPALVIPPCMLERRNVAHDIAHPGRPSSWDRADDPAVGLAGACAQLAGWGCGIGRLHVTGPRAAW